jgi:dihydroneopterin aldolase
MSSLKSILTINDLSLKVKLGWPDNERKESQTVSLDVKIKFSHLPIACQTDRLEDTLCYSSLVDSIHVGLQNKSFHLIEYLSHEIYLIIKNPFFEI